MSLDSAHHYRYEPLSPLETMRILKLLPSSIGASVIVCELEHVSRPQDDFAARMSQRRERRGYEALSYCWGSGTPNHQIRILAGNRTYAFAVHSSLHQALAALRLADRARYLWVDAICINQTDVNERSRQVARMDQVYGDASNVCVWLGPVGEDNFNALEFIKSQGLSIWNFEDRCRSEAFVRGWASVTSLLTRAWFSRRWVLQEVCLAQRATVHCGEEFVSWEEFAAAVSLLTNFQTIPGMLSQAAKALPSFQHAPTTFDGMIRLPGARLVKIVSELSKKSENRQTFRSLESLVDRLDTFQASDPRDVVYAILALANDSNRWDGVIPDHLDGRRLTEPQREALAAVGRMLPPSYRQSYQVNYKQQVVDVYQQFIHYVITRSDPTRALDIVCRPFAPGFTFRDDLNFDKDLLLGVEDPDAIAPLPSWIPRISTFSSSLALPMKGLDPSSVAQQRGHRFVRPPESRVHYAAAGVKTINKSRLRFQKRDGHYNMYVEGFILDHITEVDVSSQLGNIPVSWMDRAKRLESRGMSHVFWETLVADQGVDDDVPTPLIYRKIFEESIGKGQMQTVPSGLLADALAHLQTTILGRCLFETGRGFLGLAPGRTERLQHNQHRESRLLVCILYGCSVPVVLKEVKKTPDEIAAEQIANEKDRQERFNRIKPILEQCCRRFERRILEQRSKRREAFRDNAPITPNANDAATTSGEIGSVNGSSTTEPSIDHAPRSTPARMNDHRLPGDSASPLNGQLAGVINDVTDRNWERVATAQGAPSPSAQGASGRPQGRPQLRSLLNSASLRMIIFSAIATLFAFAFGERRVTAVLITLATPHVILDLWKIQKRLGTSRDNINAMSAFHISMGLCCGYLVVICSSQVAAISIAVAFAFIFPDVLPDQVANSLKACLSSIAGFSFDRAWANLLQSLESSFHRVADLVFVTLPDRTFALLMGQNGPSDHTRPPLHQAASVRVGASTNPGQQAIANEAKSPTTSTKYGELPDYPPPPACYYELVGECYINNMMNGEAIMLQNESLAQWDPDKRIRSQEFELR